MRGRRAVALLGVAALVITGLAALSVRHTGMTDGQGYVMFVACGLGIAPLGAAAGWRGRGRRIDARGAIGLVLMAAAPISVYAVNDTPLFGGVVEGPLAQVAGDRSAVAFRLTDATLRRDLSTATSITHPRRDDGSGGETHSYVVAPVVGPRWAPEEPVPAWVIEGFGPAPPAWAAPGGVLRLAPGHDHAAVIGRAQERHGLRSEPVPLIGRWVPDPGSALWTYRAAAAVHVGCLALLWLFVSSPGRQET